MFLTQEKQQEIKHKQGEKDLDGRQKLEMLSHSLAGGAKGSGDNGFRVSLQGAGAAGHGSDPEHSLRLVHHWENLLRLHPESLDTRAQTGHHLSLAAHKEGQRNRLLLQRAATPQHICVKHLDRQSTSKQSDMKPVLESTDTETSQCTFS